MTINAVDLSSHVIKPTLEYLEAHSPAAEILLLGTAAQESGLNPFFQHDQGIGIFQINPQQHRQVWDEYLAFRPELASKVRGLASQQQFLKDPDAELRTNLAYSTAIAWIIYQRAETELPDADDVEGLSHYWQDYFCHQRDSYKLDFSRWLTIGSSGVAAA